MAMDVLLIPLLLIPALKCSRPISNGKPDSPKGSRWLYGLRGFVFSIKDGAVLIRENKMIGLNLGAQTAIFAIGGVLYVIGIAHVQEVFPPGQTIYLSVAGVAGTAGLLMGAAVASIFRRRLSYHRTIAVGALLMGVGIIGITRMHAAYSLAIWCTLMGISISPAIILTETLLQKHVPKEFRGRVFSAREALTKLAFVGFSIIATLADAFLSKGTILVAIGLFLAMSGVVLERVRWARM
jgi:MFS family permease